MNKGDLIAAIADDADLTKAQATAALNSAIDNITKALGKAGNKVTLVGFGTFECRHQAARVGRNPQTGKPIQIAAKNVAKFKPGKELKEKIN